MEIREIIPYIKELLSEFPVTGLIGPRQVGKTTLVKYLMSRIDMPCLYLDLENPQDAVKLNDPVSFFTMYQNHCIIIDEVQNRKDLFPILRSMIDINRTPGRFILLGSASPELIRDSSESLAGRIFYVELAPFNLREMPEEMPIEFHMMRGGFPLSVLASGERKSMRWRQGFIQTYIEKDLPLLGLRTDPSTLRRFIMMMAHMHGQVLQWERIANSLDIKGPTVKRYADFLNDAFIIRLLEPYFVNIGKRLVKAPKIYIRDTGILNSLLGLYDWIELISHPVAGAFWEGYAIEQIVTVLPSDVRPYYYRTHNGAELDLVLERNGKPILGFEMKFSSSPVVSKGMIISMSDLDISKGFIITPSDNYFKVNSQITVMSLRDFLEEMKGMTEFRN